ncbi:Homeobox protein yox1 [Exophiala oligosperma]
MGEHSNAATSTPHRADSQPQYAFEVDHPPIMSSSAPSSASKSGTKARRKRTSPQDHAILETAYQKNSKPDKAERVHIVSQVNMSEKEVQIWFQNRRQNDRRRSKPLQPHELVAHLHTRTASPIPLQVIPPAVRDLSPSSLCRTNLSLAPPDSIPRPASRASSIHDLLNPASSARSDSSRDEVPLGSQETAGRSTPPSSFEQPVTVSADAAQNTPVELRVSKEDDKVEQPGSEPGSGRKRDHAEMTGTDTSAPGENAQEQKVPPRTKEPLSRSSSMVRLAMTVDGAVKVRTNNEPTPSPEKPRIAAPVSQNKPKTGLMRSKSAMSTIDIFQDSTQGAQSKVREPGFGRSRDARTWAFYCDSTAKDALSAQAEAETAGSAISAINLMRTNSLKSRSQALSPSVSKTNTRMGVARKDGKPKLVRAQSSLGRLQSLAGDADPTLLKKPRIDGHVRSPSGDSDKENWAPGTQLSEHSLRRTQPSGRQRQILQENEEITFPDAASSRKRRGAEVNSGQSPIKEKAKGDDLDCVKSLLSLSQGAWR